MTKDEHFFLQTLGDLRRTTDPRGKGRDAATYDLKKASGLLRLLLCDGEPLIHRVNKERRIKLRFTVRESEMLLEAIIPGIRDRVPMHFEPGSLDTSIPLPPGAGMKDKLVTLDKFLKVVVLRHFHEEFAVCDLIGFVAHIAGGVHMAEAKTDGEKALEALSTEWEFLGQPLAPFTMACIAQATLRTLEPLEQSIRGE